jgi:long-chain acyl-CoA synthetase
VTHESIAEGVIEQVAEVLRGKCAVLVAGDMQNRLVDTAKEAGRHGVEVAFWEDLWEAAEGQKDADEAGMNQSPFCV